MLPSTDIAGELAQHLTETLCCETALTPQTDLLSSGLVDSLMMTDFVRHVELHYDIHLDAEDLRPQHFRSAEALALLVQRKLSVMTPSAEG